VAYDVLWSLGKYQWYRILVAVLKTGLIFQYFPPHFYKAYGNFNFKFLKKTKEDVLTDTIKVIY